MSREGHERRAQPGQPDGSCSPSPIGCTATGPRRRWSGDDGMPRGAAGEAGQGGLSETERAELLRLRRENSDLKLDRAFLKKASLFFTQEASDTNGKRSS